MSVEPVMLDPLSEMLALSSHNNTKNLIITAIETKGLPDRDALHVAVRRATEKFPQMQSCISEVRENGIHRLYREHRPDLPIPMIVSDLEDSDPDVSPMNSFLDHMAPRLDRDWDLSREVAAELHCVKISEDHHIIAPVLHHAAGDAGVASQFGREFLANYHRIVTGQEPHWDKASAAVSTSGKRRVKRKKLNWSNFFTEARDAVANLLEEPTLPKGNGTQGNPGQHHIKRLFSVEETARLDAAAGSKGGSLVDLLAVAANLAVDRWNVTRGGLNGNLTTSMSVNMKGRFRGMDTPNSSALLFFRSLPEDRMNPTQFVRSVALARIGQFRRQMDLKFHRDVSRMTAALRILPFALRRRIVHTLTEWHQYSVAITLLGVIWPAFRNGRATTESCPTEAGNLTITEVHGIGYKLLSSTPVLFIVYLFRNRLNVVLAASGGVFTRAEAEQFMDLFVHNLQGA
jgi:hypothetical protein